jgi:hypothetical protein
MTDLQRIIGVTDLHIRSEHFLAAGNGDAQPFP